MNCPEHMILDTRYCHIWHWQRADIARKYVTWREVLNPLRYQICIGPGPGRYWIWNDRAWMNLAWSNFNWWLWRRRWWEMRKKI